MGAIPIIGCIVGVVGCLVATIGLFLTLISKAKQDGIMIEKIDQCVRGIEEIKKDMKQKNREIDSIIDNHSKDISELKAQMKVVLDTIKI